MGQRFNATDLGDMEVVNASSKSLDRHIEALESKVDEQELEIKHLKKQLNKKPTVITQAEYDRVCKLLQECYNESLPF